MCACLCVCVVESEVGVDGWAQTGSQTDRQTAPKPNTQAGRKSNNLSKAETKKEQGEMEGGRGEPPPRSRHALAVLIIKTEVASSIKFYTVTPRCENNSSSPPPFFFLSQKDVIYDRRHCLSAPIPSVFDLQLGPLSLILMYGFGRYALQKGQPLDWSHGRPGKEKCN